MNYFVWILRNGRLTCQAWSERTFSIHKDGGPKVVARHELKEEERGLSLYDLIRRYPAPEVVL